MKKVFSGLHNRFQGFACRCRIWWHRNRGIGIGRGCRIAGGVEIIEGIYKGKKGIIRIGNKVAVEPHVVLNAYGGRIEIEERAHIGPGTVIYGHGGVKVGSNALIAMHCRLVAANHQLPERGTPINSRPDIRMPITIGDDVWLGAGVTVLSGVTVGEGCVVAAGAVVTKDLPPYSVAMGIPAKVVREREQSEDVERISHYSHA